MLQRVERVSRLGVDPQEIDQARRRDDPSAFQREDRRERALSRARETDDAVLVCDRERAENTDGDGHGPLRVGTGAILPTWWILPRPRSSDALNLPPAEDPSLVHCDRDGLRTPIRHTVSTSRDVLFRRERGDLDVQEEEVDRV